MYCTTQAFGVTTDIEMPGMANDDAGTQSGGNTMWSVWFDVIESGGQSDTDGDVMPDKQPFCGPFGCCVPAVHYFSDESAINDPEMREYLIYFHI